jgi:hypothetical protein
VQRAGGSITDTKRHEETDRNIMGKNTPKPNRTLEIAADQKLIDGFNKHSALISSLMIQGAVQPAQTITGTLQKRIDASNKTLTSKATWTLAVESEKSTRETTATFVAAVRQGLLLFLAGQTDVLADFGLTARAKPAFTPEELLARAAKAKATRAARHTLGPKQKAAIKGAVTPTAPATTVPAAAPAVSSPATTPVHPVAPAGSGPVPTPVTPVATTGGAPVP